MVSAWSNKARGFDETRLHGIAVKIASAVGSQNRRARSRVRGAKEPQPGRHEDHPELLSGSGGWASRDFGRLGGGWVLSIAKTISRRLIEDAVCPGCGCLCDDLTLVVEGDRIVETQGGCSRGKVWFEEGHDSPLNGPTILGHAAGLETALDRGAEILAESRAPVVWGLAGSTIEAQRVALAIADRIGAVVAIEGADPEFLQAFQRIGEVSATFGEIKDRADVIAYDAADPLFIPSRFRQRVADDAVGRFVPQGRVGRTVLWLGPRASVDSAGAPPDLVLEVAADKQAAFYTTVRALIQGRELDPTDVERTTGLALPSLIALADRLKAATYGAFVLNSARRHPAVTEAKLAMIRDLNAYTRFVAVHAGGERANTTGAGAVLTWQAGAAGDLDFSLGYPRHLPRDGVRQRLERGEADAALIVSNGDWLGGMVDTIPRVLIHDGSIRLNIQPAVEVEFPTARLAIDEGGTMARADGVMLPLRPPFVGRRITQVDVLSGLATRIATRLQDRSR